MKAAIEYKLSANQIAHLDELGADEGAERVVLEIALQRSANRMNEIQKQRRQWWKDVGEIHSLDLLNVEYVTARSNGSVVVVEKEEKEHG